MIGQQPSIGRIVHYVGEDGVHSVALIVGVYERSVNLHVFYDDSLSDNPHIRQTNAEYSEESKPGTWHWPERV